MKDLTLRLSALDPEAGAALRAVTYFDTLATHRPSLQAVLRGAVTLTGAAAGLLDPDHDTCLRVDEHGRTDQGMLPPDPSWLSTPVGTGGGLLWLERVPPARTIDAVVIERAAALAHDVVVRTRGSAPSTENEPVWEEVLVDAEASEQNRRHAARRLHLPLSASARAVALPGPKVRVRVVGSRATGPSPTGRAGIGPAVGILDLPASWARAKLALRLTAEGSADDPGPTVVTADDMGGLILLAQHVGPGTPLTPDEVVLQHAVTTAPWMLPTLDAVASTTSLRAAAAQLTIHHSTLQERLTRAERVVGWSLTDAHGRLRLQLALALRRLHRPEG